MSDMINLYKDNNFCLKGELYKGMLFIHCDVYKYNKSVKKDIKKCFSDLKLEMKSRGEPCIFSAPKSLKFIDKIDSDYEILSEEGDLRLVAWVIK